MSKQVMQRALDVLTESVDGVEADYTDAVDLYSNYPSRQACIDLLKEALDKHNAAIAELRAAIDAPVEAVEPVAWARLRADGRAPDVVWQETAPDDTYEIALHLAPPDTEGLHNNLRNAVNMFQTYVDGHVSQQTAREMINALNAFIDKQGGPQ